MAGSTTGPEADTIAAEQLNIQEGVKGPAAIPAKNFSLETVQDYILRHAVRPETIHKYCYFSKGSYTRNLIFKNEVFECMTVCWEIGQHSRVHNHRDQNCWMSVPVGRLRVQNYHVDHPDTSRGTCKIVPTDAYIMDATHPSYVNPLEPVHEVINASEFNQRAVSIHVYSKPFDSCEVYQRDKGHNAGAPRFSTSESGELTPADTLL